MPTDVTAIGIDVVLGLGALATIVSLVRSWGSFWDRRLTPADRLLATQISVFLVPPVVVLLHELGHALATWAVGAHVAEFRYGLFEGSVTAVGFLSRSQSWFIAVAGNVVSIGAGLALLAAGYWCHRLRRPLRYVLIMGGVVELLFALVAYPLLSLSTSSGDWAVIYDFGATPALSWLTAVVHVSLLVGVWRWWRSSLRRTLFAVGYGEEERLRDLDAAIRRAPSEVGPRIDMANLFAGHGDLGLAAATLDQAAARTRGAARLHLARARIALHRGRWNDAVLAARAGLASSDATDDLRQRLWANEGLALAHMGRPAMALAALGHVSQPVMSDLRVLYGRGVARLESGDVAGGRADLQTVLEQAPEGNPLRESARARLAGEVPQVTSLAGV